VLKINTTTPCPLACLPRHTTPRHATHGPARLAAAAARARVWHALVHFLTSQVKWNKSHHISQGKRPLDFQCGTIGILHHYTPYSLFNKWAKPIKEPTHHPHKNIMTTNRPLELLHMDRFGLIAYISIGGSKYCLVIVDDYSRFTWVFFLQEKSQTQETLKGFLRRAQNEFGLRIKKD
jgi:hypothetical protein